MDPRFGAGENGSSVFQSLASSSTSAVRDGYVAAQALRAGYIDPLDGIRRVETMPEAISAREILKQRIRKEIIEREMTEMRLLEEEVRRELEMERALPMTRLLESVFPSAGDVPALAEARAPEASQFGPAVGVGTRMVGARRAGERPVSENVFGEWPLSKLPDGRITKNSSLGQSGLENKGLASISALNANPSKDNITGTKRKGSDISSIAPKNVGGLLGLAKRDWSCALCQVTVTSRECLNHHLQGKQHRAKQARLDITTDEQGSTSASSNEPLTTPKRAGPKKSPPNPKGPNASTNATGGHQAKMSKTGTSLVCNLCEVECNSEKTWASHLGGKSHRTRMEAAQCKAMVTAAAADPVQNNEVEKESNLASESDGDGPGIVDGPIPGSRGSVELI